MMMNKEHNFMGYYGDFTIMEMKQIVVKEYIDRNLDNFSYARSRHDKQTMIMISQKIRKFVERFTNRHLYSDIGYKYRFFLDVQSFCKFVDCPDYDWQEMTWIVEDDE